MGCIRRALVGLDFSHIVAQITATMVDFFVCFLRFTAFITEAFNVTVRALEAIFSHYPLGVVAIIYLSIFSLTSRHDEWDEKQQN